MLDTVLTLPLTLDTVLTLPLTLDRNVIKRVFFHFYISTKSKHVCLFVYFFRSAICGWGEEGTVSHELCSRTR